MTLGMVPSVLDPSLYIPELRTRNRQAVLADLVDLAHRAGVVREPSLLIELLALRERLGGTAIGKGVAMPHARSLTVIRPQVLVARSHPGVDWDAPDEMPATLILLTLTPGDWSEEAHHGLLGRTAAVARLQRNRQRLLEAESFADIAGVLRVVDP